MSANRLLNGLLRATAAGAILAAVATLSASAAQAGEIVTRNCLHGSAESNSFGYRNWHADQYGNGYGDSYGSANSYTRPDSIRTESFRPDGFRHHKGFGFRRGLATTTTNPNGGGTASGAEAGTGSGYGSGSSHGYGYGSTNAYGDDSCVEIRRELTNPYVIQVPPPATEKDVADAAARDRLWQARCKPIIRQDAHGVRRYVFAAAGCEYGKYE